MVVAMRAVLQGMFVGFRGFRSRPLPAIAAVFALTIGIGGASLVAALVHGVWFTPTYARAGLVCLQVISPRARIPRAAFSLAEFRDFETINGAESGVFSAIAGSSIGSVAVVSAAGPDRVRASWMTPGMFGLLGSPTLAGRPFVSGDFRPDGGPVAVVSYRYGLSHLGGVPEAIGSRVRVENQDRVVVGIMPPDFDWRGADIFLPDQLRGSTTSASANPYFLVAEPEPGTGEERIAGFLQAATASLAARYPDKYQAGNAVEAIPLTEWAAGRFSGTAFLVLGAAGLLLVIACVNVTNLLLAQSTVRSVETSVRAALGASPARVMAQAAGEALLLAFVGGVGGLVFALGGLRVLTATAPAYTFPEGATFSFNLPVVAVCVLIALVTTFAAAVLPAVRNSRREPRDVISGASRGGSASATVQRFRWLLLGLQVTFITVLLLAGGSLAQRVWNLENKDLGFSLEGLLTAQIVLPEWGYPDLDQRNAFFRRLLGDLRTQPGVESAAVISSLPLYGGMRSAARVLPNSEGRVQVQFASDDYDRVLGLRLLQGRFLDRYEVSRGARAAVVNEAFVAGLLSDSNALGRTVLLDRLAQQPNTAPGFEIVGVVRDVLNDGLERPAKPEVYVPYTVSSLWHRRVIVKTGGSPRALEPMLRTALERIDPETPAVAVRTMVQARETKSLAGPRFRLLVEGLFAGCGLLLAAIGVYSMVAFSVAERTREIGIRVAVGATPLRIVALIFGRVGAATLLGVLLGLLLDQGMVRVLQTQIDGYHSAGIPFSACVAAGVFLCTLLSCVPPLFRALTLDPTAALRSGESG